MSYNSGSNRAHNFKSASRFALVRFWNYSRDYSLNFTPLGPITITNHKNYRARSFGIFRNKNIFQNIFWNIFRLFCFWEKNSRDGNPGIPEWEQLPNKRLLTLFQIFLFRIDPKRTRPQFTQMWLVHKLLYFALINLQLISRDYSLSFTPLGPITITNHKNCNFLKCDWCTICCVLR